MQLVSCKVMTIENDNDSNEDGQLQATIKNQEYRWHKEALGAP